MPAHQSAMPHTVTVGGLNLEFSIDGEPPERRVKAHLIYPSGLRVLVLNKFAYELLSFDLASLADKGMQQGGTYTCTLRDAYDGSAGVVYRAATGAMARLRDRFYTLHGATTNNQVTLDNQGAARAAENPWYRRGYRHNMYKDERQELAELVRKYLKDDYSAGIGDIVACLNDARADDSILGVLPDDVTSRITYCTCGHYEADDVVRYGGSTTVCESCYDSDTWVALEDAGEYAEQSESYWSENHGGWYSYDIDAEEAESDADDDDDYEDGFIRSWAADSTNYLSSPEIESTDKGDFTIGVEFECVPVGTAAQRELAKHVHYDHRGEVISKTDGSLPAHGLELVFAPKTLESAKKSWSRIEFPSGTRAWDAKCCGTHVHIDARAFNRLSIAKFIGFWNAPANAALIRKVAGRHPLTDPQAKQYANIVELGAPVEIVKAVKGGAAATTRYRCVNLTTLNRKTAEKLGVTVTDEHHSVYNTVELRIFRASLKAERTLAQIEMAHASVMFARDGSISGMGEAQFRDWLKRKGQRYPALRTLLGIAHHKAKHRRSDEAVDETVKEEPPVFPAAAIPAPTPTLEQVLEASVPGIAASFDLAPA